MTVQFNLIPDIKRQYLKAKRLERLIIGVSGLATAACVIILVVLILLVDVKQKHSLSGLTGDIAASSKQINGIKGLNDIITVQNQLESLPGLYQQDPMVSRVFNYVVQLTPPQVTIGDLSLDFTKNTAEIKGTASALSDVNSYTDSLKQATYDDKTAGTKGAAAFTNVVLSQFSRSDSEAGYTIDFGFNPALFLAGENVTLNVPQTTNTPKVPGIEGQLFKALPDQSDQPSKENNSTPAAVQGGQ